MTRWPCGSHCASNKHINAASVIDEGVQLAGLLAHPLLPVLVLRLMQKSYIASVSCTEQTAGVHTSHTDFASQSRQTNHKQDTAPSSCLFVMQVVMNEVQHMWQARPGGRNHIARKGCHHLQACIVKISSYALHMAIRAGCRAQLRCGQLQGVRRHFVNCRWHAAARHEAARCPNECFANLVFSSIHPATCGGSYASCLLYAVPCFQASAQCAQHPSAAALQITKYLSIS
jgi:hypothetical protein